MFFTISVFAMYEDTDDVPVKWKKFHNTTREYVIFLLLFISLYLTAYILIRLFRKRLISYQDCYEDAFANRISLWLSSFSLSVSIGATLLLPISIVSNEVLLLYPNSYYVQWLNSSLIQGLWNHVFLFSNLALFLFLPFSHFIIESEGFPGSPKGIMARVNEALLVLGLIGLVIMGIVYIISAIFDSGTYIESVFNISSYYLPFLYSIVSFFGVLMLLLCTPVGIARLFSIMTDLLMKRKVSKYSFMEKINYKLQDEHSVNDNNPSNFLMSAELYHRRIGKLELSQDLFAQGNPVYSEKDGDNKSDFSSQNDTDDEDFSSYVSYEEEEGKPRFSASAFRRNCVYPIVILFLIILTVLSVASVIQNTLALCVGIKSLPISSQNLSLGISSLSSFGPIGAGMEIIMILYHWCTSVVGLYSLPLFCHLKPKLHNTSLSQVIGNCAILLVLSSAFPVLARSLGITNFDLLGDFGKINWLGNFYIVLFHNITFAFSAVICLLTKITDPVRNEITERLFSFPIPFTFILTVLKP